MPLQPENKIARAAIGYVFAVAIIMLFIWLFFSFSAWEWQDITKWQSDQRALWLGFSLWFGVAGAFWGHHS